MYSIYQIIDLLLAVLWFFVIAHVIMSWLINFQVLNIRQPLVYQVWNGLQRIITPIYAPIRNLIRKFLPSMGAIDLSPLVVILIIISVRIVLKNNVELFY